MGAAGGVRAPIAGHSLGELIAGAPEQRRFPPSGWRRFRKTVHCKTCRRDGVIVRMMGGWRFAVRGVCFGAAALVLGCAGARPSLGSYEQCMADGAANRERVGTVRAYQSSVYWEPSHNLHDPLFRIVERRETCMNTWTVTGRDGLRFEAGPFRWVHFEAARESPAQFVFTAKRGDEVAVFVNGEAGMPYDQTEFSPRYSRRQGHLGYVARRSGTSLVVVDGAVQLEHPGVEEYFRRGEKISNATKSWFAVLEDGRSIAVARESDGRLRTYVGGKPEGHVVDDLIRDGLSISPDGKRYAYRARIGHRNVMVVDGEILEHPGVPGPFAWSEDGTSYGLVVVHARVIHAPGERETPQPAEGYVIDGAYTPLAGTQRLSFVRGHWVVSTRHPSTLVVLGVPTPDVAPTDDAYRASTAYHGVRVRLGESLGPLVDSVRTDSFRFEDGVISYTGTRKSLQIRVVNNVIERPAPVHVQQGDQQGNGTDQQQGDGQQGNGTDQHQGDGQQGDQQGDGQDQQGNGQDQQGNGQGQQQ